MRQQLIENVDYYIENGRWVFTEAFHLKRGTCCGSRCRHCPYEHINVLEVKRAKRENKRDNV
ncbi:MAG: DUF5522 domain-containing protein [Bacteroidota bacterium]